MAIANTPPKARVVVLVSGSGTNLQAIIDAEESGYLPIKICAVISNQDQVKGLERAEKHNIPAIVIDHRRFSSRDAFDSRLRHIIDTQSPDIVVLAGFMRILTAEFTRRYKGKLINIHPSLLPKYQGLHTHKRVLESGDTEHGATVHFVTAELDGGPAIIQARVEIETGDTEESLAAKVLVLEHKIYPLAIHWLAQRRVTMRGGQSVLDGKPLPTGGHQFS